MHRRSTRGCSSIETHSTLTTPTPTRLESYKTTESRTKAWSFGRRHHRASLRWVSLTDTRQSSNVLDRSHAFQDTLTTSGDDLGRLYFSREKDKGQKTPTYTSDTRSHIHTSTSPNSINVTRPYDTLSCLSVVIKEQPPILGSTISHTPTQPHCRLANDTRTLQGSETYSFRLTRHGAIHRGKGESLQRGSYKRPPFQAQVCDA